MDDPLPGGANVMYGHSMKITIGNSLLSDTEEWAIFHIQCMAFSLTMLLLLLLMIETMSCREFITKLHVHERSGINSLLYVPTTATIITLYSSSIFTSSGH